MIPADPKHCLMGILEILPIEDIPKQAIAIALFQARKMILRHWKSMEHPTLQEWITQMRVTIRLQKLICQNRGKSSKFDKLWAPWLDIPGLAPVDLVYDLF